MLTWRHALVLAVAAALVTPGGSAGIVGRAAVTATAPTPGPVVTLATGARSVDVAVDRRGVVTEVWATHWWNGPVRAVRRSPHGAWGTPVTLGRGHSPQVATDDRGNVTVMWSHNQRETTTGVRVARRPAAGHWSEPVRLTPTAAHPATDPARTRARSEPPRHGSR